MQSSLICSFVLAFQFFRLQLVITLGDPLYNHLSKSMRCRVRCIRRTLCPFRGLRARPRHSSDPTRFSSLLRMACCDWHRIFRLLWQVSVLTHGLQSCSSFFDSDEYLSPLQASASVKRYSIPQLWFQSKPLHPSHGAFLNRNSRNYSTRIVLYCICY
jgi:hypothetical protein